MKATTREMLNEIDKAHDWRGDGPRAGRGAEVYGTYICRICSLRRHWSEDPTTGQGTEYRFSDGETGEDLSLRQALQRGCA